MSQLNDTVIMNYHMFDISINDMTKFIEKNNITTKNLNGKVEQFLFKDDNICFWCSYIIGNKTARIGLSPSHSNSKFIINVATGIISLFQIRNTLSKFFTPLYSQYNDFDSSFKEDVKLLSFYFN